MLTLNELKEFSENVDVHMNTQRRNLKEVQDEKASLFESRPADIREKGKSKIKGIRNLFDVITINTWKKCNATRD